jgi:hypothetical protein
MLREEFIHLEHRRFLLAENLLQLVVSQDLPAVIRVLQLMRLDIFPHFADHLATGQHALANDCGKRFGRFEWLLQRIRLVASLWLLNVSAFWRRARLCRSFRGRFGNCIPGSQVEGRAT